MHTSPKNYTTAEDIKKYSDILEVVNEVVTTVRRGNRYWALCPFHEEKTASFLVDPVKQLYYCFGCHAKGDVIDFVMRYYRLSFPEAIDYLARKYGIYLRDKPSIESVQAAIADRERENHLKAMADLIIQEEYSRLCRLEKCIFRILNTIRSELDLDRPEVIESIQAKDKIAYWLDSWHDADYTGRLEIAISIRGVSI